MKRRTILSLITFHSGMTVSKLSKFVKQSSDIYHNHESFEKIIKMAPKWIMHNYYKCTKPEPDGFEELTRPFTQKEDELFQFERRHKLGGCNMLIGHCYQSLPDCVEHERLYAITTNVLQKGPICCVALQEQLHRWNEIHRMLCETLRHLEVRQTLLQSSRKRKRIEENSSK